MKRGLFIGIFVGIIAFTILVFGATPVINDVVLNSTNLLTNSSFQNLTGYVDASDGDGDNITYVYNWYKDDVLNRTTLIETGLKSYFPFDNDVYDYFGSNDNLSLSGDGYLNTTGGQKDGDVCFEGAGYASDAAADLISSPEENMTLSVWVFTESTATYQTVVSVWNNTSSDGFEFKVVSGTQTRFLISDRGSDTSEFRGNVVSFSTGEWHHLVVVFNNDTSNVSLYVDGSEVGANPNTGALTGSTDDFRVGINSASAQNFNGSIDELMVFNRTLSSDEVSALYYGALEERIVSSSYLSAEETWKMGAKVADNETISSETNSSSLEVNSAILFSDTASEGIFNYVVNASFTIDSDLDNQYYSFADFNDTIRWWIPFTSSTYGNYTSYTLNDGGAGVGNLISDSYGGSAWNLSSNDDEYPFATNWAYELTDDFWSNQEFTVSSWVILNNNTNTIAIPGQQDNAIFVLGKSTYCDDFGVYSTRSETCYGFSLEDNITYDEWLMVTMVYDNGTIYAYFNGELMGTYEGVPAYENTSDYKGTYGLNDARMWVGNDANGAGTHVTSIGEFLFLQRAMNPDEIPLLYNSTNQTLHFEYYDSDLNSDENITLTEYLVNGDTTYDTGERNLQINNTLQIYLTNFLRTNLVIQRNLTTNNATIKLEGNYSSGYGGNLLYSINGVEYSDLDLNGGLFSKNISLSIGTYDFKVYSEDYPLAYDIVEGIGVGDVIVITGQSNSIINYDELSSYYTPVSTHNISFSRVNGSGQAIFWDYYDTFEVSSYNNMWLPLMDQISYTQDVPVMMISGAMGSTQVSCWNNVSETGDGEKKCYIGLMDQLSNLTYNNTVYGLIYYQGEGDFNNANYKEDWLIFLSNVSNDINLSSGKILLGNTFAAANDAFQDTYYPNKATQELWVENASNGVVKGAYVYDMNTTEYGTIVHFYNISNEGWPFVNRWKTAGLYQFYGEGDMKIPNLTGVYLVSSNRVDMIYDRSLSISEFLGNSSSIAWGLQIYNDTEDDFTRGSQWNMSHVTSTSVNSNIVSYYFNETLSSPSQYSYCINNYCVNKSVVRDSTSSFPSAFPSLMVYPANLTTTGEYICGAQGRYWYNEVCNDNPQSTTTTSSGGGSSATPSSSSLELGYTTNIRENFDIVIGGNTLIVTNLEGDTATIEIAGGSYEVTEDETVKIDTDNDGYYDVQVSAGSVNDVYATLTFKTIYEEVPAEEHESQTSGVSNYIGNASDKFKNSKAFWIVIGVAGLILISFAGYNVLKKK